MYSMNLLSQSTYIDPRKHHSKKTQKKVWSSIIIEQFTVNITIVKYIPDQNPGFLPTKVSQEASFAEYQSLVRPKAELQDPAHINIQYH